MSYARQHLDETARVVSGLDAAAIERMVTLLADLPGMVEMYRKPYIRGFTPRSRTPTLN